MIVDHFILNLRDLDLCDSNNNVLIFTKFLDYLADIELYHSKVMKY